VPSRRSCYKFRFKPLSGRIQAYIPLPGWHLGCRAVSHSPSSSFLFTPGYPADWWLDHLEVENWFKTYQVEWCLNKEVPVANQMHMLAAMRDSVQKDDFFLKSFECCLISSYLLLQAAQKTYFKYIKHIWLYYTYLLNIKLWEWSKTCAGTGCSERLWSFHPWRYSNPDWIQYQTTYSKWACLSRGVEWDNLQRCLPTTRILQFYG